MNQPTCKLLAKSSLIVGFFLLIGCSSEEVASPQPRLAEFVMVPAPRAELARSFSGILQSTQAVNLSFEVGGRTQAVLASQGRSYPAGAVLARLDATDYETRLDEAKALHTQATQDLRRLQRLFESGNTSQSQLDAAIAQEMRARASDELARKQVEYCTLKMPYAGMVASVDVDAQEVVKAGQTVMRVQGEGAMQFEFSVPSNLIAQVAPGQELTVQITDAGSYAARVKEVSPVSEQNAAYPVIAQLLKVDAALREGMDGEASLEFSNPDGQYSSLPLSCVSGATGGSQYVWVIEENEAPGTGKLMRREVEVGPLLADGKIAIMKGLAAEERVLSRGVNRAEAGQVVRLQ